MSLNLIILIALAVFFTLFIVWINRNGFLPSISDSVKHMPKPLFTLAIWTIAFTLMIVGNNPLLFFAGGLLSIVGVATDFWYKPELRPHLAGAIGSIFAGLLYFAIYDKNFYPLIIQALSMFFIYVIIPAGHEGRRIKGDTQIVEILAFYQVIFWLMLKNF